MIVARVHRREIHLAPLRASRGLVLVAHSCETHVWPHEPPHTYHTVLERADAMGTVWARRDARAPPRAYDDDLRDRQSAVANR